MFYMTLIENNVKRLVEIKIATYTIHQYGIFVFCFNLMSVVSMIQMDGKRSSCDVLSTI